FPLIKSGRVHSGIGKHCAEREVRRGFLYLGRRLTRSCLSATPNDHLNVTVLRDNCSVGSCAKKRQDVSYATNRRQEKPGFPLRGITTLRCAFDGLGFSKRPRYCSYNRNIR